MILGPQTLSLVYSLHSLSRLPGNVDQLEHLELGLLDMQVFIEAAAFAPLGHYRQIVLRHVAHEKQDVHVPCFTGGGRREGSELSLVSAWRDLLCFCTDTKPRVFATPPVLTICTAGKANT